MATTIGDNIHSMAALVATVKKQYHLTEATVLRIVDMNFALAQAAGAPSFGGDEDIPFDPDLPINGELLGFPANVADIEDVEEAEDDPDTTPAQLEN